MFLDDCSLHGNTLNLTHAQHSWRCAPPANCWYNRACGVLATRACVQRKGADFSACADCFLPVLLAGLGGSLAGINKDQVKQLPKLINVLLGAPATSVQVGTLECRRASQAAAAAAAACRTVVNGRRSWCGFSICRGHVQQQCGVPATAQAGGVQVLVFIPAHLWGCNTAEQWAACCTTSASTLQAW
jgi:hypothetical protein